MKDNSWLYTFNLEKFYNMNDRGGDVGFQKCH